MIRRKRIKTTCIFRCIVTLKNGGHKIMRMTIDKVAKFVRQYRDFQRSLFPRESKWDICDAEYVMFAQISEVRFVNEYTGEELLSIA